MNLYIRIISVLMFFTAVTSAGAATWDGEARQLDDEVYSFSEPSRTQGGAVKMQVMCNRVSGMQLELQLYQLSARHSVEHVLFQVDDNDVVVFKISEPTEMMGSWQTIQLPSDRNIDQMISQMRAGHSVEIYVQSLFGDISTHIKLDGFTTTTNNIQSQCG